MQAKRVEQHAIAIGSTFRPRNISNGAAKIFFSMELSHEAAMSTTEEGFQDYRKPSHSCTV